MINDVLSLIMKKLKDMAGDPSAAITMRFPLRCNKQRMHAHNSMRVYNAQLLISLCSSHDNFTS
jgi:hypothetical protein